jgi:hypothetical protein
MIDWADPGQRARLIERIGVDVNAYTVAQEQHSAEAVVATVAGHAIRLGQIFIVGDTGKGFATLDAANTYAHATRRSSLGSRHCLRRRRRRIGYI